MPAALELPTDRARPAVASMRGAWLRTTLPASARECPARHSRSRRGRRCTPCSSRRSTSFSTATRDRTTSPSACRSTRATGPSSRTRSASSSTPSCFASTSRGTRPSASCSSGSATRMLDAIAHQRLPFEQLVRGARAGARSRAAPALPGDADPRSHRAPPSLAGLDVEEVAPERASAPIDLTVFLEPRGDVARGGLGVQHRPLRATTIERMQGHFLRLLEAIVAEPDRPTGELPMLSETERDSGALPLEPPTAASTRSRACTSCSRQGLPPTRPTPAATYEGEHDVLPRAERAGEPARASPARARRRARGRRSRSACAGRSTSSSRSWRC